MPLKKSFFCRSAAAEPQLSGRTDPFGGTKSLQATLFRQRLSAYGAGMLVIVNGRTGCSPGPRLLNCELTTSSRPSAQASVVG